MNGYLLSVSGTVLLCSLLTALAPEGKTASVIKGIAKLACVLAFLAPVLRFFQSGNIEVLLGTGEKNSSQTVIEEDEAFIQYYSEKRVAEAESLLERELEELYAVQTEARFSWTLEEETVLKKYAIDGIRISKIQIHTPKETTEEVKERMRAYLLENYCSEVQIE